MRKILPIFLTVISFLSIGVSTVSAQSPRRFYDWSTTFETSGNNILGTQTFAQIATGSGEEEATAAGNATVNTATNETATPASSTPSLAGLLQFNRYIIGGNLGADSPFHFIKNIQENIQLTFTFDPKKKDEMRLAIAGERLDEAQRLSDAGKIGGLGSVSNSYRQNMLAVAADVESLKNKNVDIADLLKMVEVETAKHNVVLEKVQAAVPDEAKDALEKAIEASEVNIDKVADLTNKPAVPPDVVTRITALRAQGLLTEEEAAKLIGAKTRSEARGELRKYVNEGIVPESDFLRMNENVKAFFPTDFYEIHEVKRFYTLKKLEQEKPDEATLGRIQEFAKIYKPGEVVPPDIRRYWGPIIQLDEIQTTLRPDLISRDLFKNNAQDYKKFNEIVERYKPRPEDVAFLQNYIQRNRTDVATLPPEYQRMYRLADVYGAQCGSGQKWFRSGDAIGYCAPQDYAAEDLFPPNPTPPPTGCRGNIVSAKSQGGICSAYPSDCVPPGWTKVDSCVVTQGEEIGIKNTERPRPKTSCPSNAHFVPVSFDPSGGYCVPNYTPTGDEYGRRDGIPETACPTGYHRNYSGGPCLQDIVYREGLLGPPTYYLPPVTVNPGNYPNPFYPSQNRCGAGTHWVPEPINPAGGYCASDNYQPTYSGLTPFSIGGGSREEQEATCKASGGTCVSWVNGACGCERSGSFSSCKPPSAGCGQDSYWDGQSCTCRPNGSYPSACAEPSGGCGSGKYSDRGTCTCATPCQAGYAWNGNTCMKSGPSGGYSSGCQPPQTGCPGGWFDYGSCSCRTSSSGGGTYSGSGGSSSGCQMPSGGCGSSGWFDWGSCSCKTSSSNYSGSSGTSSSCQPPSGGCGSNSWYDYGSCSCKTSSTGSSGSYSGSGSYTPPSGYGTCGSGQYWNGSSCVSSSSSSGGSGTYTPPSTGTQSTTSSPPPPTQETQTQTQTQSQPRPADSGSSSSPPPGDSGSSSPPPADSGSQPPPSQ